MNYDNLGLTKNLRSKDNLLERAPESQNAMTFEYLIERAAVRSAQLSASAVGNTSIADLSVTTSKLAGSAVTNVKLASSSVDSRVIANEAVGSVEIGGSIIQGTHIALNAITNTKINDYDLGKGTGNLNTNGGTFNSGVIGTPTIIRPTIDGTANFDVNAGSAALAASGDFAIQTHTGSVILAVRSGGTTYYFTSAGTL